MREPDWLQALAERDALRRRVRGHVGVNATYGNDGLTLVLQHGKRISDEQPKNSRRFKVIRLTRAQCPPKLAANLLEKADLGSYSKLLALLETCDTVTIKYHPARKTTEAVCVASNLR